MKRKKNWPAGIGIRSHDPISLYGSSCIPRPHHEPGHQKKKSLLVVLCQHDLKQVCERKLEAINLAM